MIFINSLIRVLRIEGLFDNEYTFPRWMGTTIRGVFGYTLRREVCPYRRRSCSRCNLAGKCPYNIIFETNPRTLPGSFTKPGYKLLGITKPYVLSDIIYRLGSLFIFELNIFGSYAIELEPLFIKVLIKMGKIGLGRCKKTNERRIFSIKNITAVDTLNNQSEVVFKDNTYYSSNGWRVTDITFDKITDAVNQYINRVPRILKMNFLTPTMVISNGKPEIPPRLSTIFKNITRKALFLSEYFWNQRVFGNNIVDYIEKIERYTKIEMSNFEKHTITRYSMEKHQYEKIPGFITGSIFYKINPEIYKTDAGEQLFLALVLGRFLHVGKLATMGGGIYEFEVYS